VNINTTAISKLTDWRTKTPE